MKLWKRWWSVCSALAVSWGGLAPTPAGEADASGATVTFCRDIASIFLRRCASCHRPGQAGPFPLLTYADVKKRARQIAEVTASRYMPPWLPEPGLGEFANDRSLNVSELASIQRWVEQGAIEGAPPDLPPRPGWSGEWQLGPPDWIVEMPEPYSLLPDGKDVYRNFVMPIPTDSRRFVRGFEFIPGNPRVVHHAFINTDQTRLSRQLAARETPPGFEGMDLPESAHMPGGQLLSWQPGRQPSFSPPGLAWVLEPKTDLVLQIHFHPSGKPELVQPKIGFYFTDTAPTNTAYRVKLEYFKINIPAGESAYQVEQSYVLPIDVSLLRILPHAHYLGKQMSVSALRPDGSKRRLLFIKEWDFNWQADYAYQTPLDLPKGTRLVMNFSYDNSSRNVRNPHRPPQPVRYGLESTDEMASCSLQVLPRRPEERETLAEDFFRHYTRVSLDYNEYLLQANPKGAIAHGKVARAAMALGDLAKAQKHLGEAIRVKPDYDKAYYDLGAIWLNQNRLKEAKKAFEAVVHLNPTDYQAYGSLGIISLREGRFEEAEAHLRTALRLNPDDTFARKNLDLAIKRRTSRSPNP